MIFDIKLGTHQLNQWTSDIKLHVCVCMIDMIELFCWFHSLHTDIYRVAQNPTKSSIWVNFIFVTEIGIILFHRFVLSPCFEYGDNEQTGLHNLIWCLLDLFYMCLPKAREIWKYKYLPNIHTKMCA